MFVIQKLSYAKIIFIAVLSLSLTLMYKISPTYALGPGDSAVCYVDVNEQPTFIIDREYELETTECVGPLLNGNCYLVPASGPATTIDCAAAAQNDVVPVEPIHDFPPCESADDTNCTPNEAFDEPEVPSGAETVSLDQNPIITWMVYLINVAIAGVGIIVVGAIIFSGIQYMLSQGNSQKTAAARDRIISSLIGLALFSLMAIILQWLIPGGVFD